MSFAGGRNLIFGFKIPPSMHFLCPPAGDFFSFFDPFCGIFTIFLAHYWRKVFDRPSFDGVDLVRIGFQIGKGICHIIHEGNDDAPMCCGRGNGNHFATCVDDCEMPRLSTVMLGFEGSEEGLALIIVDEILCNGHIIGIQRFGIDKEIKHGRKNVHRCCVCFNSDAGEMGVAQDDRNLVVTDMRVLIRSLDWSILFEGLATIVTVRTLKALANMVGGRRETY